jgi:succinoglycan biosynthesis protein ExoM
MEKSRVLVVKQAGSADDFDLVANASASSPESPQSAMRHICVCACTYRRPAFLTKLLQGLDGQKTDGTFTFSIVIADNDGLESARSVVETFAASSRVPIKYCVEPRQNITLARNKAVANADGDFIAFMDDDEFPPLDWLITLFRACTAAGVDAVIGPVKPHFDDSAPKWVVKSRLYERASYPTGPLGEWRRGRVNNILFRKEILASLKEPFNPEFRAGEDIDFVRRLMENGKRFMWCREAAVWEEVPKVRWKRGFMMRRSLLQGTSAANHPTCGAWDISKSMIAAPLYTLILLLALPAGQDKFMILIVKICYHLGKLLGAAGLNVIKDAYVLE